MIDIKNPLFSIMAEKAPKTQYRIRDWSEYDTALKNRGSLIFWVDEEVLAGWLNEQKIGKRGASQLYSDLTMAAMSTMGSLLNLAGRQPRDFMESLFGLMGVELEVPDHTTVSRRLGKLSDSLPIVEGDGPRHIVVDSTGIKVYGEGERNYWGWLNRLPNFRSRNALKSCFFW